MTQLDKCLPIGTGRKQRSEQSKKYQAARYSERSNSSIPFSQMATFGPFPLRQACATLKPTKDRDIIPLSTKSEVQSFAAISPQTLKKMRDTTTYRRTSISDGLKWKRDAESALAHRAEEAMLSNAKYTGRSSSRRAKRVRNLRDVYATL